MARAAQQLAARNREAPVRKRVELDLETWQAVDLLGRDAMKSFQELTDEAFRDLLKKHGRADTLRTALKHSAAAAPDANGRVGVELRSPAARRLSAHSTARRRRKETAA